VLTLRELNRATLARQLLLERRRLGPVAALERVAGLQAQWAPAPYVGLWTRIEGFRRETLERQLLSGRIVRAVLMRGTIHLVSHADFGLFGAAVGAPPWGNRVELDEATLETARAFCATPRTRAEISAAVEHPLEPRSWYTLRTQAGLTHAPESGLWKSTGVTRYVAFHHEPADMDAARAALVRRYLGAFGPASRTDVAAWSGLRASTTSCSRTTTARASSPTTTAAA
jgi:winged helix DNA-binding protein